MYLLTYLLSNLLLCVLDSQSTRVGSSPSSCYYTIRLNRGTRLTQAFIPLGRGSTLCTNSVEHQVFEWVGIERQFHLRAVFLKVNCCV